MEYLKEIPRVSYYGVDADGNDEFELEGEIERLPETKEAIVFIGNMSGTIYISVGRLIEHEIIKAEKSASGQPFTRLKIKGRNIAFRI